MSFGKKVYLSFLVTFLFCLPFVLLSKNNRARVLHFEKQSATVPSIIARVGEYQIGILSGYASPYAEVFLNGQGTSRKTTADKNGYYEFLFVPVKKSYGELCLTSQDVNLIPTLPVCLPPIPPTQNVEIIGVLLPPTISLDKGKILLGESAKASGMTFPDSDIDVYLFEKMGLPKYSVKSNSNGYFEFSLPSAKPAKNRLFATAFFPSSFISDQRADIKSAPTLFSSPKTNTLSFLVFKPNWLWLLLALPIILIALIFGKKKNRQLMVVENDILSGPKMLKIL